MIKYSFERYEKKYIITRKQQEALIKRMAPYMQEDNYGKYPICNIYYDTEDWRFVRASLEKPVYKEKLRMRSYGVPDENGRVFTEIKKKYDGVVYKRRITSDIVSAEKFLNGHMAADSFGQIGREIMWFQNFHKTKPKVFIGYERLAFAGIFDPDIRITFDTNIRWRDTELDLRFGNHGELLLDDDMILTEIKLPGVCPLWLADILSDIEAFPTSFSKYGFCWREHISKEKFRKKEAHLCA